MWLSRDALKALREELEAARADQDKAMKILEQLLRAVEHIARHYEIGGAGWLPGLPEDEETKK